MDQKQAKIAADIEKVKAAIGDLGRFRPGTLSKQGRARGGRYSQIVCTRNGRTRCEYVRPDYEPTIRAEVATYRRMRGLVSQWIDLELELSRIKQAKHARKTSPEEESAEDRG